MQSLSFTSAAFAWSPAADDSGWGMYEVEANALPRSLLRFGSTTPSKTVTNLVPGLTYTVAVVAVDGSRNRSAPVTMRLTTPVDSTPPTTPAFPRSVTVNGVVDTIAWSASSDSSAVQYVLRSSGNRIFGTRATSVTAFELLYLDCVVAPGSMHAFAVVATTVGPLLLPSAKAWAHAELVETSPSNGAHLDTAPREVVLRFTESVNPGRTRTPGSSLFGGIPILVIRLTKLSEFPEIRPEFTCG